MMEQKRHIRSFSHLVEKDFLDTNVLIENMPYILLLVFLALIHISNNHMAKKIIRETLYLEKQSERLRWEYLTVKSELMHKSKQSEVALRVKHLGLKELKDPPFKLQVKK